MKTIQIKNGNKAIIVDDEDFPYLSRFRIVYTNNEAFVTLLRAKMKYTLIPVWCFIVSAQSGKKIAFKNKDPLDFRKINLYFVHNSEKNHRLNKRALHNGRKTSSKYKGVSKNPDESRIKQWQAQIQKDKKLYFLGFFKTEKEAATAYNKKARELYGRYAYQNKIL